MQKHRTGTRTVVQRCTEHVILSTEQYKQGLSSHSASGETFGAIPERGVILSSLALRELASNTVIRISFYYHSVCRSYLYCFACFLYMHPLGFCAFNRERPDIFRFCFIFLTFVQDGIGRLVARQRLLAEVLVRLGQALHFGEACVECHGWVAGVLCHVEVSRPPQLLLDHKRLLQQLQDKTCIKMHPDLHICMSLIVQVKANVWMGCRLGIAVITFAVSLKILNKGPYFIVKILF